MTVNVYHKHTVVKDKAPDAKQIELGEIAICANQDSPAIYIKDSADSIVKVGADFDAIEEDLKKLNQLLTTLESLDGSNVQKLIETLTAFNEDIEELKKSSLLQKRNIEANEDRLDELEKFELVEGEGIDLDKSKDGKITISATDTSDLDDLEEKVEDHETRIVALRVNVEKNEGNIEALQTTQVIAGVDGGLIVTQAKDTFAFTIEIDKDWLDEVIKAKAAAYLMKDIGDNLEPLS